jgi:hypothetical protein
MLQFCAIITGSAAMTTATTGTSGDEIKAIVPGYTFSKSPFI